MRYFLLQNAMPLDIVYFIVDNPAPMIFRVDNISWSSVKKIDFS